MIKHVQRCDGSTTIVWSLYYTLHYRRVKKQFCQVIRVQPVHSLKVLQLPSEHCLRKESFLSTESDTKILQSRPIRFAYKVGIISSSSNRIKNQLPPDVDCHPIL